jgi:putative transposase
VLAQCKARHRHQEFLAFLNRIDAVLPAGLDVHLIVDSYATHKHPKVRAWLAQRQRFQIHYTPTYASWLNQVERWFALLTSREIRRGSFASAKDLVVRITAFVAAYNATSRPFAWTATADDILAKLARLCNVISGTAH